ncbi:MAG: MarR family transcriptional regulator [Myxococcales bacterium]|nr:MarR family transcriptional regulator [Myxococcales bacterium]
MRSLGTALGFLQQVWELTHALQVSSKRMARTIGVTGPQRLVLRVVGAAPGITARELATTLGLHPSTLTGVLGRLERQKFLIRRTDPDDRRRARFVLTARGKKVDAARRGTVEAAVRRALARADQTTVAKAQEMLALLVTELEREH